MLISACAERVRSVVATSSSTFLSCKSLEILSVLGSDCFAIKFVDHSSCHDNLLTILCLLLDFIFSKIELVQATHSLEQREDLVLQIIDPIASHIQILDTITKVELFAFSNLIVADVEVV